MKHARDDYNRIQDPAGMIPDDEPVFLIRAKDINGPEAVEAWALLALKSGAKENIVYAAMAQAKNMRWWQAKHGCQTPDMP